MRLAAIMVGWMGVVVAAGPVAGVTLRLSPKDGGEAFEKVRDDARELRKGGESVVVEVADGTYVRSRTLELGPEDSGTIWRAATGTQVRVCGGPVVGAEKVVEVTDEGVLRRLKEVARGKVVRVDLAGLGVKELAEYPVAFRGVPGVPEVFFNDQRMRVARWPNQGWATIAKFVETGAVPRYGDASGKPGVFEYSEDEPAGWDVSRGVWLQGYWCYDWYDEAIRVKAIDAGTRRITLAGPAVYGVQQGNPSPRRFRAINLLEELDEAGEYYVDRERLAVYLWPPGEVKGARVVVSMLAGPLVRVKGAENVSIEGMTFEAGLGNGIEVIGGKGNRVVNCVVRNMRELGIRVSGGTGHRVEGCEICETGTGGLVLEGGDRRTLTPGGHEAVGNRIHGFSRHQLTAAYGITIGGVGNRVAHNDIYDAPHQAVYVGGNDHVLEYNLVHDVVTETDDAGAVYKGRNPSCRGNVIRYNLFKDIGSPRGAGTSAIYFDDGDGGDTVFGNVFVRCGDPGGGPFGAIFSHGGHDNRAENNVFVECKRALGSTPWDDARWADAIHGGQDCQWTEKLLKEVDVTKPPYTTRYPELVGFMEPKAGAVRVNRARNNVLVRCGDVTTGNWRQAKEEVWVTDQDPGFVDLARADYRLRGDADVYRKLPGFKAIPVERIGPGGR